MGGWVAGKSLTFDRAVVSSDLLFSVWLCCTLVLS